MTTKSTEDLEKGVLAAARALAVQQHEDQEAIRRMTAGQEKLERSGAELDQAELELAEADLAYARAKQHALESARQQREQHPIWLAAYLAVEEARKALWEVASSGDEARILQAAREFGDTARLLWQLKV